MEGVWGRPPIFQQSEKDILKAENQFLKKYLERRILFEIAIVIGRSNGVIHISQLQQSKAGKYANLYFEKFSRERNDFTCFEHFVFQFGIDYLHDVLVDTYSAWHLMDDGKINPVKVFRQCLKRLNISRARVNDCELLFKTVCEN